MRAVLPLLLVLAVALCADAQNSAPADDVASVLFGTWEFQEFPPLMANRQPCRGDGLVEYRPDHTFVVVSDGLTFTGYYVAERVQDALLVTRQITGHNGGTNCVGLGAERVIAHTPSRLYLSVEGHTLRQYLGDEADGRHLLLLRRSPPVE